MKNFQSYTILLCSVFVFFYANSFAQIDYRVPATPPKAAYKLELNLNLEDKLLEGHGSIHFRNTGKKPMTAIAIDDKIAASSLIKISQNGEELEVYNPDESAQVNPPLFFNLHKPVEAGEDVNLNIAFKKRLMVDDNAESFESQELIPQLWWDGITVSNSYKVKIDTENSYAMAVSGRFNKETGYYESENVKTFGLYCSKTDKIMQDEIKGVQVRVLYPENGKKVAKLALQTAKEVIPYYINLMGFYPYTFINIIPGGDGVWGGYPFATGIVVIHGMQFYEQGSTRHWRWITAHEIGHEYWGEYVLDGDEVPFLWIALGIYADWKFSQHIGLSDWKHRNWANYYLRGVKKGYNTTMDIRAEEESTFDFDRNNYVHHAKGFSFISALEMVLGEEIFQKAYVKTLLEYGGKRLTNRDFQQMCEKNSGENLDWFFDAWLRSNKYLAACVSHTTSVLENDKYNSTVNVYYRNGFYMPVPIYATFEDGSFQVKMSGRAGRKSVVKFTSKSKLTGAVIDPSGCLANLEEQQTPKAEDVKLKIRSLSYSGAGDKAHLLYRKALSTDREKVADEWYKLGMALYDGGYNLQARTCFYFGQKYGNESKKFINSVWLGHMYDLTGSRNTALEYYQKAIDAWDGNAFTHSQYNMTVDKAWAEQRLKTPFKVGKKLTWE